VAAVGHSGSDHDIRLPAQPRQKAPVGRQASHEKTRSLLLSQSQEGAGSLSRENRFPGRSPIPGLGWTGSICG